MLETTGMTFHQNGAESFVVVYRDSSGIKKSFSTYCKARNDTLIFMADIAREIILINLDEYNILAKYFKVKNLIEIKDYPYWITAH